MKIKHKIVEKVDYESKLITLILAFILYGIIGIVFGTLLFNVFIEIFSRDIAMVSSTVISMIIPIWKLIKINSDSQFKVKEVEHVIE